MVTSPTGKGVIAMGRKADGENSKAMFELSQSMQWKRLEQTLQIEYDDGEPVAIPIPDELVSKQEWNNSRSDTESNNSSSDTESNYSISDTDSNYSSSDTESYNYRSDTESNNSRSDTE